MNVSEASQSLRELASPIQFGERVKSVIDRAAKRAGLSYWRAFDVWYQKARRIEEFETDQINEALHQKRDEANRNELHELRTRLARLESILVQTDPQFHRENVDALRHQVRGLGGMGSALARPAKRG